MTFLFLVLCFLLTTQGQGNPVKRGLEAAGDEVLDINECDRGYCILYILGHKSCGEECKRKCGERKAYCDGVYKDVTRGDCHDADDCDKWICGKSDVCSKIKNEELVMDECQASHCIYYIFEDKICGDKCKRLCSKRKSFCDAVYKGIVISECHTDDACDKGVCQKIDKCQKNKGQ